MTDHPIKPTMELVQQWTDDLYGGPGTIPSSDDLYIATRAAQWGADRELSACEAWLDSNGCDGDLVDTLVYQRRNEQVTLKRALQLLNESTEVGEYRLVSEQHVAMIRSALEAFSE